MATKRFAIPLDKSSKQTGDITLAELVQNNASAEFQLTNVTAGSGDPQLNLITSKGGTRTNHVFNVTVVAGTAKVTLSVSQMGAVFGDADGGDWDYVEASWAMGAVDTPNKSVHYMVQSGHVYDYIGWPPN